MRAVVEASALPVSVKMRLGWDENSINVLEMAARAEKAGVAQIAVHGRTRMQQYSGTADWEWIARVKESVSVPVIGNGDILTAQEAIRRIHESNVDGVMIARGAMGNPWIFGQIRDLLAGREAKEPTVQERAEIIRRHYDMLTEWKGEAVAVREMRKHIAWYLHGLRGASRMRAAVNTLKTSEEVLKALDEFVAYASESADEGA